VNARRVTAEGYDRSTDLATVAYKVSKGASKVAARSAKYSLVRNADTFSASAMLISWFTVTPSAFAIFLASSIKDGRSLSANCFTGRVVVTRPSWVYPP
jgi:hypothetical protein